MKRGKKIGLVILMVIVALAGTIGGVALAQSGDEDVTPTSEGDRFAYLERVCEIYQEKTGVSIDVDTLKDSLCQAADEQREQLRNQFRQHLIDEGILTEEQLAELEAWLESKPDFPIDELKEWFDSRPDDLPKCFGFGNRQQQRSTHGAVFFWGKGFGIGIGGGCPNGNNGN